jgi:DNA ligase-associated metallophosphoesterase
MRPHPLNCQGQQIWLSPDRCIYWENEQILLLSDMHIGKSAHFRKAGIAIPQQVFQEDLHRFFQQVHLFSPKHVIVTGDFFHSFANLEHEWFSNWRKVLGSTKISLVRGNHEILLNSAYEDLGIEVIEKEFYLGPFHFSHELLNEKTDTHFSFVGHTHPGIKINGKGMGLTTLYNIGNGDCIILDGKQSNVLVKLYLNNPKNLFFQLGKEEGKYSINSIDDILNYSKEIKRFIKSL